MNHPFLTVAALTLCFAAPVLGQQTSHGTVPSVIKNAFASTYPQSTDVEWEHEDGLYKVEFETDDEVDREIWYDANSKVVREETEIEEGDLPAAVLLTISTEFSGYSIDDVERIITPDGEHFRVEIEALLKEDWEITLAADGSVVKQEAD